MLSSHEMQRVSEAMQRLISGESAMQDSAEASVEQPLAASMQRSSVVTEETDGPAQGEPGEAAEAVDTELPTRRVSPARESEQGEAAPGTTEAEESAPATQRRMDSLLSMALGRSRPVVDNAAVTARDGGLQGPEGTDAVLRGESIQQSVLQHPVMPEHPGNQAALPDRLLQFSNPAPAADVSGYALDELPQQLIDRLNTLRNAGNGLYNVKMDLYPKELGRLVVNMAVRGDNVILQVAAINQGQRDELRRSLVSLKQALEEEGMSVVDMRVIGLAEDGAGRDTQRQTAR